MSQFTRTITIFCEDLGGSSTPALLLTFDDQLMKGIYRDYFPVVWKVSTFPTKGSHAMTVTYKNQLVFINPQVENDKYISAETWVDINLGQQTDLIRPPDSDTESNSFTTPTDEAGNNLKKDIKAFNKTPTIQKIGVGFDDGGLPPPTVLLFDHVGSMYNVTAEFTPTLSAYITEGYQENSVIREAIQTPVIWKHNLAALQETSNWRLTYDPISGDYSINPEGLIHKTRTCLNRLGDLFRNLRSQLVTWAKKL